MINLIKLTFHKICVELFKFLLYNMINNYNYIVSLIFSLY